MTKSKVEIYGPYIEASKAYLVKNRLSIPDILDAIDAPPALKNGGFARYFTKIVGVSASQYRQSKLREQEEEKQSKPNYPGTLPEKLAKLLVATRMSFSEAVEYIDAGDVDAAQAVFVQEYAQPPEQFRQKYWDFIELKPPVVESKTDLKIMADVVLEVGKAGPYEHILHRHGVEKTPIGYSNALKKSYGLSINALRTHFDVTENKIQYMNNNRLAPGGQHLNI